MATWGGQFSTSNNFRALPQIPQIEAETLANRRPTQSIQRADSNRLKLPLIPRGSFFVGRLLRFLGCHFHFEFQLGQCLFLLRKVVLKLVLPLLHTLDDLLLCG